jgi:hypothetical protein
MEGGREGGREGEKNIMFQDSTTFRKKLTSLHNRWITIM